eukprot:PhF_6_TR31356/c0_g1_i1/m.45883/K05681/ABCG2, CD338; ATP-binding cassette, subfamily G (WHITE), member 2
MERMELMSEQADTEVTRLINEHLSICTSPTPQIHPPICQVDLAFRDLKYSIPPQKKGEEAKQILKGVTGYVKQGQMLAILGPSGAGKTTMLDILARREKKGNLTGEVLINGHEVNDQIFKRISAYVQQDDLLHGYLTVEETVDFNAQLRLPATVTAKQRAKKVKDVLKMLGIHHIANRQIGSEQKRGISGGEKKRTAIACELVTDPALLFLDEPTTGLDTFNALHLMHVLKRLCSFGCTVVFSIHQPRAGIFAMFDLILLLNGFGEQSYFGPANEAMKYFAGLGIHPLIQDNPADFILDSVSAVRGGEDLNVADFPFLPPLGQAQRVGSSFQHSPFKTAAEEEIEHLCITYLRDAQLPPVSTSAYPRGFLPQVWIISKRAFLNKLRDPVATVVSIVVAIMFALVVGSIYWQLGHDQQSIQDRLGVLFFLAMNGAFSNLGSLALFLFDRSIYVREHANGMYRPSSYFLGKILQDVPLSIVVCFIFDAIAYWMCGLRPDIVNFLWFCAICILMMLNSYAMCMFVSSFAKNYQIANLIAPLVLVLYLIPSGFLVSLDSIPWAWRWIKYISFFRYGFEALVINEFDGLTFDCDSNTTICITTSGTDYLNKVMHFPPEDFTLMTGLTAASIGVYLFFGYLCLRAFQQENK